MSAQTQSVNQSKTVNAIAGWPSDVHDESELDSYLTDMCNRYGELNRGKFEVESDALDHQFHW